MCLLQVAKSFLYFGKYIIRRAEGHDGAALVLVVVDDGLGVLVESCQSLLDGLLVVVDAAGSLSAVQESLHHHLVGDLEVQHLGTRHDRLLELDALGLFSRITVDEEAFGGGDPRQHGLRQQVQHHLQRDEVALLHDGVETLAPLRARADLLPQQVAGGEVGVAILLHDLVTLRPLPAPGSSQDEDDR